MKRIVKLAFIAMSLTSCATIAGGQKYNAHIQVVNNPNAEIVYNGNTIGLGSAMVKIKRKDADKVAFTVKQNGYEPQQYNYHSRSFRPWALFGSIFGFTGLLPSGVPLPWGAAVDGINGAWWKPNVGESGVVKQDYKNYKYLVSYAENNNNYNKEKTDVIYLKNGSIIKGSIIEQIPYRSIKIETKDGSIFIYNIDEIEKMTKENK